MDSYCFRHILSLAANKPKRLKRYCAHVVFTQGRILIFKYHFIRPSHYLLLVDFVFRDSCITCSMVIVINFKDTRIHVVQILKKSFLSYVYCWTSKRRDLFLKKKIKFRISGEKMALSIPMHSLGKNRRNN